MKIRNLIIAALAVVSISSCDESSKIGSSVTEDKITVSIDSSFVVTGESVKTEKVQSRTVAQLIGNIDAPGFGKLSSDVVTQFMPASVIDTANIRLDRIDSLVLVLQIAKGEYIGDSIVPLGLDIFKLNRQLPSPIYSNFNAEDYYSPEDIVASKIYNVVSKSADGINASYGVDIRIKLPLDFARDLYRKYLDNPATYSSPTAFADFFPGFYIKNSFGSGRLARVGANYMSLYYNYDYYDTKTERDTVLVGTGNYYAVTPEIITNNNVSMQVAPEISKRVDEGEAIVMAPVGMEVKMRFPAPEIIAAYRSNNNPVKVLNSLTFSLPGEPIKNDFDILPPNYLLLVLSKDKEKFFANNSLPDNITSFYATYNSSTGMYPFGDMREYLISLLDKDSVDESDYTFSIVPVAASFETNQSNSYYNTSTTPVLSKLTPYMASPIMVKLNLDKAKLRLTFSSQTIGK